MILGSFLCSLFLIPIVLAAKAPREQVEQRREPSKGSLWTELPAELFEIILSYLPEEEHPNLFAAFPKESAPISGEMAFIASQVGKVESLWAENYELFKSTWRRLEDVQRLLTLHHYPQHADADSKVRRLLSTLASVAQCKRPDIMNTMVLCPFARAPDFLDIWRGLSEEVQTSLRVPALQAIVLGGNTQTFTTFIAETPELAVAQWNDLFQYSCAQRDGAMTMLVLQTVLARIPSKEKDASIMRAFTSAVICDQVEILHQLRQTFKMKWAAVRPRLLATALAYGRPNVLARLLRLPQTTGKRGKTSTLGKIGRLSPLGQLGNRLASAPIDAMQEGLIEAAKNGNLNAIKLAWWNGKNQCVKKSSARVKFSAIKFGDVLLAAAKAGNLEIVEFFLSETAGHALHWSKGITLQVHANQALAEAASNGHLDIVKFLLRERNSEAWHVVTPLYPLPPHMNAILLAAGNGHLDIVSYFFEEWANNFASEEAFGRCVQSALFAAARGGMLPVIEYLMQTANDGTPVFPLADRIQTIQQALRMAVVSGNEAPVAYFMRMEEGKFVLPGISDVPHSELLYWAVQRRSPRLVDFLLRKNSEDGQYVFAAMKPAVNVSELFETIAKRDDLETLKILLERDEHGQFRHLGLNPPAIDHTIITRCIDKRPCHQILQYLLSRDSHGNFLFPELEPDRHLDTFIQAMLRKPDSAVIAAVGDAFPFGRTRILQLAIDKGDRSCLYTVISALKEHIQMPPHIESEARSIPHPAMVAIFEKRVDVLKVLLERDVERRLFFRDLFPEDTLAFLKEYADTLGDLDIIQILNDDSPGEDDTETALSIRLLYVTHV